MCLAAARSRGMGFARLLYHEPQYAIIDEGTSAVSSDVEGLLYETCKEKGISEYTPRRQLADPVSLTKSSSAQQL